MEPDQDRAARIAALGYDYASPAKDPVTACNLCGSTRLVEVARRDRYGYEAPLWICTGCGLGFLSPRLTPDGYADFYRHVYRPLVSAYHGRLIDASSVQAEQREYADQLLAFLTQRLPEAPATVLDVGGSTGVVGGRIGSELGSRVTVLDPAPDELEVAAAAGMETIAGFAEDFAPGGRTWDLVLLCQTIDHLVDIRATLAGLRGMTAQSGFAFVDVLDFGFMTRRRGRIEGAVKIDHPYYLTRATALAYFDLVGFSVVAERASDDGHWGFLLRPSEPLEPDRRELAAEAGRCLDLVWHQRARAD